MKHFGLVGRTTLFVLLCVATSFEQTSGTGALTGTITDANGARLPEVAVTVTNQVFRAILRRNSGMLV